MILKTEYGSPACVELENAQKFVDSGWAKQIIFNVLNSGTIVTIPVNSSISTSGLTFSPSTVQVVIGVNSTVEWINMDSVMNDITSDSRSFETSLIPHGHAWEYVFDKIGTYQYHSAIHPWLKGTVIVVENNTSSQQISNSDRQAKLLSENDCGQFYTVPENHTSLNTV
ncbi:MAG: cupredoxin domain-containing protein, partial [Thaumarchaeota archaeon]|nr:cupredoxin domain-containing protein [Nitrososphaerota archaeon]